MAERRMFAKSVVLSDTFLDMTPTARCLYFSLGMLADDDGFVNSVRSAMRQSGTTDDDLRELIACGFIIPVSGGLVVVRHWKTNNYIRADRYQETNHKAEKAMLKTDDSGGYLLDSDVGIPYGIPLVYHHGYTQDRLGKVRLGKDRLDISYSSNEEYSSTQNIDKPAPETKKENQMSDERVQEVVSLYHEICKSLPRIEKVTDSRRVLIRKAEERLKSTGGFAPFFERVERSDFLTGRKTNWRAGFDWIMKAANLWKIIEGNYDNRKDPSNPDYTDQTRYENLEL